MPPSSDRRSEIIRVAIRLFSDRGFAAVRMDDIARQAALSRRTLYKYFGTKEGLTAAAVREYGTQWRHWLFGAVDDAAEISSRRLPVLFDVLHMALQGETLRQDLITRALFEFPDKAHPAHKAASAHQQALRKYLHRLARYEGRFKNVTPGHLTPALELLFEGVLAVGRPEAASEAKALLQLLLDQARGAGQRRPRAN